MHFVIPEIVVGLAKAAFATFVSFGGTGLVLYLIIELSDGLRKKDGE